MNSVGGQNEENEIKDLIGGNCCDSKESLAVAEGILKYANENGINLNKSQEELATAIEHFCVNLCKPLKAVVLVSDSQFTLTEKLKARTICEIIRYAEVGELEAYLLNKSQKDEVFDVWKVIDCLKRNKRVSKFDHLFNEVIQAFDRKLYCLACLGLVAVFDGMLADITNSGSTKLKKKLEELLEEVNRVLQKINERNGYVMKDDVKFFNQNVALISFVWASQKFVSNSDFTKEEPKYINRHWIAHGRLKRRMSELDCIKLFRLLYGMAMVGEVERRVD